MKSVYDLAIEFIHHFVPSGYELSNEEKKLIVSNLKTILDGKGRYRLSHDIISKAFSDALYKNFSLSPQDILGVPKVMGLPVEPNLLDQGRFYMHPELRITSCPPVIEIDIDKGVFNRVSEEYFLEMRCSYTVKDLVTYYYTKKELLPEKPDGKRIKGSMSYLLGKFDLEIILFMIDAAHYDITTNNKKAILVATGIEDYYPEAKQMFEKCLSQAKESGDSKVVPKRRDIKQMLSG